MVGKEMHVRTLFNRMDEYIQETNARVSLHTGSGTQNGLPAILKSLHADGYLKHNGSGFYELSYKAVLSVLVGEEADLVAEEAELQEQVRRVRVEWSRTQNTLKVKRRRSRLHVIEKFPWEYPGDPEVFKATLRERISILKRIIVAVAEDTQAMVEAALSNTDMPDSTEVSQACVDHTSAIKDVITAESLIVRETARQLRDGTKDNWDDLLNTLDLSAEAISRAAEQLMIVRNIDIDHGSDPAKITRKGESRKRMRETSEEEDMKRVETLIIAEIKAAIRAGMNPVANVIARKLGFSVATVANVIGNYK
jgi:DNA-binding transcriptional regulator YiaG